VVGLKSLSIGAALGSGYYNLSIKDLNESSPGNLFISAMTIAGFCDTHPHLPAGQFQTVDGSVETARIASFSVLVTPKVSPLFVNGEVAQAQLASSEYWPKLEFEDVSRVPTGRFDAWKDGAYSMDKPIGPSDLDMHTYTYTINDEITDACYDYCREQPFLAVMMKSTETTPSSFSAAQALLTVTHSVEFVTESSFFAVSTPEVSTQDYIVALELKKGIVQHHANGFHLKDIADYLASFGRKLLRAAPAALSAVDPLRAPLYAAIGSLL
jgi:hypothetical protein